MHKLYFDGVCPLAICIINECIFPKANDICFNSLTRSRISNLVLQCKGVSERQNYFLATIRLSNLNSIWVSVIIIIIHHHRVLFPLRGFIVMALQHLRTPQFPHQPIPRPMRTAPSLFPLTAQVLFAVSNERFNMLLLFLEY